MRILDFSGCALKSCVAVALFAGCGGSQSQPPIGSTTASAGAPSYSYHRTFYYTGKKQTFPESNYGNGDVSYWKYPSGSGPSRTIRDSSFPAGATVSIEPK
ncbi:MAG: hypothetical protein WA304_05925 [Candidatus Cybelea sp.]